MSHPVIAIVNPIAGAGRKRRDFVNMLASLGKGAPQVEIRETAGPGDGRQIAASLPDETAAVVAVGGDGTVREIAEGLVDRPIPMVVWPAGTENLVARHFGFRARAAEFVNAVAQGQARVVDTGRVNGKSFLVVVGVGFDGDVAHRLQRKRNGHINHLSYAGPIMGAFFSHAFPEFSVQGDDGFQWSGRGLAFVGNMSEYAMRLPVVRDALPDDGLLDLVIMPCHGRWGLLKHSFWTVLGKNVEQAGLIYRRIKRVRIDSPNEVPIEVDGDAFGHLPIEVEIVPRSLNVKVPAAANK